MRLTNFLLGKPNGLVPALDICTPPPNQYSRLLLTCMHVWYLARSKGIFGMFTCTACSNA